MKNTFL